VEESQAAVIREATAKIVDDGWSLRRTAKHVGMGITTLTAILRREALRGVVTHNGQVVRDESGLPVRHAAILDDDEWLALQAKLDGRKQTGKGGHKDAAMLLGVARCGCCDKPVYLNRRLVRGKPAPNYRHAGDKCERDGQGAFSATVLESAVESELLALVGDVDMVETATIEGKGDDLRKQIKRVQQSMEELDASYEAGDVIASTYGRMQARLESKLSGYRATLDAMDPDERDGHTVDVPLNRTYRQHWDGLDVEGRGAFLRSNGVTLRARRAAEEGEVTAHDVLGSKEGIGYSAASVIQRGHIYMTITFGKLAALAEAARTAR
jgi:hypothetical protein